MSLASDFIDLLLPKLCVACETPLVRSEKVICLKCRYDLPRTRFDSYYDNPVARLFWGRVTIEYASSYFKYQNGSRFQSLIHNLKYRDRKDIGLELGRLMGIEIKDTVFSCADIIMPVPLHRKKEIQRGYNQCDPICEGLSGVLDIPFSTQLLERSAGSSSQTSKSRFKRWENVEGIFRVKNPDALVGKHILLADDVVTTGSTLEACAGKILEVDGTRVSIVTLAVALKSF
ncbi:MAG TPA: ComF family protein [Bacteroides sp.]|nr:ComF family protein [Bacteroides sp.]